MRRAAGFLCIVAILAAPCAELRGSETDGFSDVAVEKAIRQAVRFLLSSQGAGGSWSVQGGPGAGGGFTDRYAVGRTALVAYALLEAGTPDRTPAVGGALSWIGGQKTDQTYCVALRANAMLAGGAGNPDYRKLLAGDVTALIKGMRRGGYGYELSLPSPGVSTGDASWADYSNGQYGVLGVWAGARAGMEIPRRYWLEVEKHWLAGQNADGGWGYRAAAQAGAGVRNRSYPAMTAAGVATLFVCMDNLHAGRYLRCRSGGLPGPVSKGLGWLEKYFAESLDVLSERWRPAAGAASGVGTAGVYGPTKYYFFGLERVGLASGYKYFGKQDWYKAIATELIASQNEDGAWDGDEFADGGTCGATAYALLFLLRGRAPVLFNKLRFNADWNNRPRDLAALTRWTGKTFERTVNWQIIHLDTPVEQWHDAPILYISASEAPKFTGADMDKLRRYVWQGGTIFSVTECDGPGFRDGIRRVYARLFPRYELVPAGPGHELDSAHVPLRGRAKLHVISNGIRPLAIHTDLDLSVVWQARKVATATWAFNAAANVFMYVTGRGRLRRRGAPGWPGRPGEAPRRAVRLARLKHAGNYDPEPLAFESLARRLANEAAVALEVLGPMPVGELAGCGAKLAAITGFGAFALTENDRKLLKQFVARGGTLIVDAAGGPRYQRDARTKTDRLVGFAAAAEKLLAGMFGSGALMPLSADSPIYKLPGREIRQFRYRPGTRKRLGAPAAGSLRAVMVGDRPGVIYSREDLTAALVGYAGWAVDGYESDTAFELMRNIILYAGGADGEAGDPQDRQPAPRQDDATRPARPAEHGPASQESDQ